MMCPPLFHLFPNVDVSMSDELFRQSEKLLQLTELHSYFWEEGKREKAKWKHLSEMYSLLVHKADVFHILAVTAGPSQGYYTIF